jgi:hypothetical protein
VPAQRDSSKERAPTSRDESDDLWVTIKNVALPAVDAEIICPSHDHAKWANRIAVHYSPQSNPVTTVFTPTFQVMAGLADDLRLSVPGPLQSRKRLNRIRYCFS